MKAAAMEAAKAAGRPGSEVGMLLRACREKAGYDLDELSRQLRIRRPFLEALEDGRVQDLPGLTYASGFVRTYADYFGLDAAEILRRFRAECGGDVGPQALRFPAPVREGSAPKAGMILLGLMIAGVAYGVWYFNSVQDNAIVELVYPVPERLRHLVPEQPPNDPQPATSGRPAPPAQPDGAAARKSEPASPSETAPVVVSVPLPPRASGTEAAGEGAIPPRAPEAAPAPSPTPPPPAHAIDSSNPTNPIPEAAHPSTLASADTTQVPPAGGSGIVLRAKSETWLQIRDTQDKSVLVSRTLKAGEEFRVPDRPSLVMTTGNAGGLEITVDGETLPPLGREGTVRRNVLLAVEPLRAATAVLN